MNVLYLVGFSPVNDYKVRDQDLAVGLTLDILDIGSIRCWFRYIEADHFQGPEAEANLADLEWLTPRVLLHESAVSTIAQSVPFYPTRFGTLFSSTDSLVVSVERWQAELEEFFAQVSGLREWGIKIFLDRKRLEQQLLAKLVSGDPKDLRGADYLRIKREQRLLPATIEAMTSDLVSKTEVEATSLGLPHVRRSIIATANEAHDDELVANLAMLGDDASISNLSERIEKHLNTVTESDCFRFEVTGPWAAYSFCPSLC